MIDGSVWCGILQIAGRVRINPRLRAHGVVAMSLVGRSLSLSSCGISHPSSRFKHRGVAGAWLQTPSRSQLVLRVANVVRSEGNGEVESSVAGNPSSPGALEVSSADVASVALNQVAPPVGNVFACGQSERNRPGYGNCTLAWTSGKNLVY